MHQITSTTLAIHILLSSVLYTGSPKSVNPKEEPIIFIETVEQSTLEESPPVEIIEPEEPPVEEVKSYRLSDEEIDLIALVTMAEAEGESEEGQRLVIDTILNRMDHVRFPDTAEKVIYQKNQFTSMWNGRVNKCYVRDDIRALVIEELESRTNYDVVFFTSVGYSRYGKPLFKVGGHWFSSYS